MTCTTSHPERRETFKVFLKNLFRMTFDPVLSILTKIEQIFFSKFIEYNFHPPTLVNVHTISNWYFRFIDLLIIKIELRHGCTDGYLETSCVVDDSLELIANGCNNSRCLFR